MASGKKRALTSPANANGPRKRGANAKTNIRAETVIHDFTGLLRIKFENTLQDGKGRNPSVFVAQIEDSRRDRRSRDKGRCVLKVFPLTATNKIFFQRELAANVELVRHLPHETADEAYQAMFTVLSKAPEERWPRCLGQIQVPTTLLCQTLPKGSVNLDDFSQDKVYPGLIMEYLPNLVPLTTDLLNDQVSSKVIKIIGDLHAMNVLHRDHVDHSAWPQVRFGNLFIREDKRSGQKEPIILDFNRAKVLGDTERDDKEKEDEMDRIKDLLARAMSGRLAVDYLSKEAQRLL